MPLMLISPKKEIRNAAIVHAKRDGMEPTTSQRDFPVALSLSPSKHRRLCPRPAEYGEEHGWYYPDPILCQGIDQWNEDEQSNAYDEVLFQTISILDPS